MPERSESTPWGISVARNSSSTVSSILVVFSVSFSMRGSLRSVSMEGVPILIRLACGEEGSVSEVKFKVDVNLG